MHDHAHGHGLRGMTNRRLLVVSLCLTASVMVLQIVGAALTGSLALLADAAHMFADAAALVIALVASTVAARPADERRTFGYQRAEVFGALVNGVILLVLASLIGVEAVSRLLQPASEPVAAPLMLVIAIIGLCANAFALWMLSSAQRGNINVRGAYLEVLGDLLGSAAVIVAAIVIVTTGWMPADAAASLIIAVLIIPRALGLLREVVSVLAESAPRSVDLSVLRAHLRDASGVVSVHDLHLWQLTRGESVFTAHVRVDPAVFARGEAGRVLGELQQCVAEHFAVSHATFQLEPATGPECEDLHD